jgi:hypothetical protein
MRVFVELGALAGSRLCSYGLEAWRAVHRHERARPAYRDQLEKIMAAV